ncbi:hypothetical protein BGY98DRAFT_1145506 [Russula aff. rugulosa BPL654]|nr:hypothetical protein BGY98DRAFT_1145506 [Russula aff. rugulosa BPL654]
MIMVFLPHPVIPIPSAVVNAVIHGMNLSIAARYLGVAGVVALLYDHSLTFGDEINLICTAPRSFLKWVFLTNHYMVEMCLIVTAHGARRCRKYLTVVACYSMISTFIANFIGFLRVIALWDNSPRIMLGLSIALTISFLSTMAATVASLISFEPAIIYDPSLKLCLMKESAKPFIVLWAAPLVFDITVLAFIVYNSLSNPRDLNTTLRRVLHRDGILFFLVSIRRHRATYGACSLRPSLLH